VAILIVGSFFLVNLILAVIMDSFIEMETKDQELKDKEVLAEKKHREEKNKRKQERA